MQTPKRASKPVSKRGGGKAAAKPPVKKAAAGKAPKKAAKKAAPKKAVKKNAAKQNVKKAAGGANGGSPGKAAKKIVKAIAKGSKKVVKKAAEGSPKKPLAAKPAAKKAAPEKTAKAAPVPSRRPKSFEPRDVARGFGFPADAPEIPEFYGEDRLVLMTKDPEYLFAYWEITPEKLAAGAGAQRAGEEYREAMRLNWEARNLFERNFAVLPVSLAARKWYLRVPFSGLSYHVELGWLGSQGHFIPLLASSPSDAPESWSATRRRLKGAAKGSVLARTLRAGRPQGSSEGIAGDQEAGAPAAAPGDWNFSGPGSLASSFGKKAGAAGRGGKSGGKNGPRG